jgi:hypothetical protein
MAFVQELASVTLVKRSRQEENHVVNHVSVPARDDTSNNYFLRWENI